MANSEKKRETQKKTLEEKREEIEAPGERGLIEPRDRGGSVDVDVKYVIEVDVIKDKIYVTVKRNNVVVDGAAFNVGNGLKEFVDSMTSLARYIVIREYCKVFCRVIE